MKFLDVSIPVFDGEKNSYNSADYDEFASFLAELLKRPEEEKMVIAQIIWGQIEKRNLHYQDDFDGGMFRETFRINFLVPEFETAKGKTYTKKLFDVIISYMKAMKEHDRGAPTYRMWKAFFYVSMWVPARNRGSLLSDWSYYDKLRVSLLRANRILLNDCFSMALDDTW